MRSRDAPSAFTDCCLKWRSDKKALGLAREIDIRDAVQTLGMEHYETVCLNYSLHALPTKPISLDRADTPSAGDPRNLGSQGFPKVLKRVTLKAGFRQFTSSEKLSDFDLIAAQPNDEEDLHLCCTQADVDIISLKLQQKSILRLKLNLIQEAMRRGIYFEICLSPALRDVAARRYLIGNATTLIRATKGKNIIVSSGARDQFETRGPYDLINLACVFGLTQQQAYDALVRNPAAAIKRGEARKVFKGIVQVEDKVQFLQEHPEDISLLPSSFG